MKVEIISLLSVAFLSVYVVLSVLYSYKVLRKRATGQFGLIDLDSVKINNSASFSIDPVQVCQTRDEINISILGLNLSSEIKIQNAKGDVIYEKETDKSYERIALETSHWKKGMYIFSYAESGKEAKRYVSGVFEV